MRSFLTLIFLAGIAQAGEVRGRVLDPSGAAVERATITAIERNNAVRRTTTSDPQGEYRFSLPSGDYLIEVTASGFGPTQVERAAVPDEPLALDLTLDMARISTRVQVTASSTAQTIDEQAKAMDVVTVDEIDRRAEFSVVEALRLTPGLRIQQLGGPSSFTRILSRGMRPTDTAVLIDGFRFRDAGSPQGEASSLLSDLLVVSPDRIEVLRGSGASLYGTHASAAVVNLVTDAGGGDTRGEVSFEGGGLGLFRGLARASGSALSDRVHYSAGAAHLNITDGVDHDDRARTSSAQGYIQMHPVPAGTLSARVLAADSFLQLNDSAFAAPAASLPTGPIIPAIPNQTYIPAPNDPDNRRMSTFASTMVSYLHRFGASASARIAYNSMITRRDNRDGPAGVRFEPLFNDSNRFDGGIQTLQARTDLQLGRFNLFTAGYEFERETFDNQSRDQNPVSAARVDARLCIRQRSHSIFFQDQIRLLDNRLNISFSGRTQGFDLNIPRFSGTNPPYSGATSPDAPRAWTGDAAIAYLFPGSGTKIRAHAGNGYRAPALFERYGASFFFGSFSAFGDPRLAPERLIAFDGGVDQYLANNRLRVSATMFYTRIQESIIFDLNIAPDRDPFGRFGGYANNRGGLARGVELQAEASPTRSTTLVSSYTYTNADERISNYIGGSLRSVRIFDHMFTLTATQRIGRPLSVTFDLLAASEYLAPFSGRLLAFPGPRKADVAVIYSKPLSDGVELRLFTRAENIFNRVYYEDGFPTPKAWATAGIKLLF